MMKQPLIMSALAAVLFMSAGPIFSADEEQVYGSQLMTQQERLEYHERLRNAKTNEERNQIRKEHHERMKKRAKAQGKSLPDEPPAGRGYMEPGGSGLGGGMSSGGGGGGR